MSRRGGHGSKKELEFELNLTSFIDLLSTCTCFLLISAVWVQIGTVEIKQSHGTEAAATKKNSFDLDLVFKNPEELRLNLKKDGKQVKSIEVKSDTNAGMLIKLNEAIGSQIYSKDSKAKKIEIAVATVTPKSTVNYGQLISALDVLRKNQIVNIGVLTARGQ
ncbi:MAG: biopolymer transporter ExbD [Bacteriovorax sp.]|nr:biopolymer transporter ExbD [Bacteriovorax sp.]